MQIVYDFVCVVASSENIFCKSHHNVSSTDCRRYSCGVHVERNTKTVPRKPQHRSWRISQDSTGNFRWVDRCRFRLQPCGLFQARGQHWPRWNCRKTALLRLCDLKISMWKTNEKQILNSKILKLATKFNQFWIYNNLLQNLLFNWRTRDLSCLRDWWIRGSPRWCPGL